MKFKCSKEKLLENINIVIKAIPSKTSLPILECILLKVTDDGFKMISNDLEMGIETDYIETDIISIGTIALEAKMFFDIVRRLPDGVVTISVAENKITTIKCGKTEFKILGMSTEEFPMLSELEEYQCFNINGTQLRNMIRQTIFSVAVVDRKPALKGELFEIENGCLNVVAVDGFRVSYVRANIETDISGSFIIPAKTLNEVSRILPADSESMLTIYVSNKYVLLDLVSCRVVSRLLEGDFIKYDNAFTDDCTTVLTVDRAEILQSLERAALISSRETKKNPVKFKIEYDNLTISSNTDLGASRDELTIAVDGNNMEIAFNPKYLIEVLKVLDQDTVKFSFTTDLSPCIIRPVGNDDAKYLVLPFRTKY